jgi:hypothetical protein
LLPQMTEADQHEALKIVTEMTVKPKAEAA